MTQPSEKDLAGLTAWVTARYERHCRGPEVLEALTRHNEHVLGYVDAIAEGESVSGEDHLLLRTVAVLHDAAKAEVPLLLHAQAGAELAEAKLSELDCDAVFVEKVARAILCHMGPLPFIEEEVHKYRERTGEALDIPAPQTHLEKLFYDADMLTLMEIEGIEKVVVLRGSTPEFITEDEETARRQGITPRSAAYASALQSVHRAAETLFSATGARLASELGAEAERHVATQTEAELSKTSGT